ncbi:MAG: lipopolysaccharide heptosyltransferase I [Gammaproteobacteria bacterium]
MRILIVKTSSLGDVVHMLPAITDAARMIPDLTVDWVVEESFQAVPNWHPVVDKVIPVAIRRWRKNFFSSQIRREIKSTKQIIRSTEYDAIIDSQGLFKSSVITHWAKGRRYGYNIQSAREPLSCWAYDQRIAVSRDLHAIERNRQITASTLGYSCEELSLDYGLSDLFNDSSDIPDTTLKLPENYVVGLHGTSRPDKEWPEENWLNLAEHLDSQATPLVLPWGNQREHDRARRIAENTEAIILPKLDLDNLAKIIQGAKAVVGMDTGLMHIAAALDKTGAAIYPVTKTKLTGVISGGDSQAIVNLEGLVPSEIIIKRLMPVLTNSGAENT